MEISQNEIAHFLHELSYYDGIIEEIKKRYPPMQNAASRNFFTEEQEEEIRDIIKGAEVFTDSPKEFKALFADTNKCRVNPLVEVFSTGVIIGMFYVLTHGGANAFKTTLASTLGSISVRRGRWARVAELKIRLLSQAEAKWEAGSLLLHNEMADELLEDNPKAAAVISKSVLLAALKPIAAKYGKVRGLKGIRKEKLPPK